MAGVYSTQFVCGSTAAPRLYTVPSGKRAVIKCIVGVNTGGVADMVSVDIGGVYIFIGSVPGASQLTAAGLMVVVNAGQTMRFSGGANFHLTCSGYLLDVLPGK
jgi:hypothetical protein